MGGIVGGILGAIEGGRASKNVADQYLNAEHGILGATGAAENDIQQGTRGFYPYQTAGETGLSALQNYVGTNPKFNFNPQQYFNSPGFNFQLKEGQMGIENAASAMGLGASGNTLRDLSTFGQGLASTYYNQAFNQAQQTFATNQNTTLANLEALIKAGEYGTSGTYAGNLALGQTGMAGAEAAGNAAIGLGNAQAGGKLSFANNIGSAVNSAIGLIPGGGIASILAGLGGGAPGANPNQIDPGSGLPINMIS